MAEPAAAAGIEALDAGAVLAGLEARRRGQLTAIEILPETDSTNDLLLRLPAARRHGRVVLAERQTAGRGRRARSWHSPAGGNIYLSLGWRCARPAPAMFALSPAVAIAVCRALARFGLEGHGIKWPNDIVVGGAKLAGILVELKGGAEGACDAVIGVGINLHVDDAAARQIGQRWTDLGRLPGVPAGRRNALVALLIDELLAVLGDGARNLEALMAAEWPRWDALLGHRVRVQHGGSVLEGTARGVTETGALKVSLPADDATAEGEEKMVEYRSAEVRVRRA